MTRLTVLTADVVCAYVAQNKLNSDDLPRLIASVHSAFAAADQPAPHAAEEPASKPTAAQIRRSITPDALISFLDGRGYKMLKRHLTTNGLTVSEYKTKFGLPDDYPSTAPSYSAARSAMAHSIGLGQTHRTSDHASDGAEPLVPLAAVANKQPEPAVRARNKLHLPFSE